MTKEAEKKTITDYFQNMEKDERQVEFQLKQFKLGRWNVGMQKGVYTYDKTSYEGTNVDNLYDESAGTMGQNDHENGQTVRMDDYDVDDLEEHDERLADELNDQEANDISGFGEDYTDGNYYGEDQDNDFGYD